MKKIASILLATAGCALIFSCASTKNVAKETVHPTGDWELIHFEKSGVTRQIAVSTLTVEEEKKGEYSVTGFSGVNDFGGKFTANGTAVSPAANFISTKMMGPKAAMEFENEYLAFLTSAESWKTFAEEGTEVLEIASKDSTARFRKMTLEGTSWKINAINTGNALVSVESDAMLSFTDNGEVNGNTGINVINFPYTVDNKSHSIKFSQGQITMMAGSPEEMETEKLFLDNLVKVKNYSLTGKTLTLYSEDGAALLSFTKQDLL